MPSASVVSFVDPEIQRCPFPVYDVLRLQAPVYFDPTSGLYVLTRYEDVQSVLFDYARFSNDTGIIQTRMRPEVQALYETTGWLPVPTLLNNDPPSHRAYRALIDKAFNARRVAGLQDWIRRNAADLIDRFIDRDAEVDLVSEFAVVLPLTVIADLVGMDRGMIEQMIVWADTGVELTSPVLTPSGWPQADDPGTRQHHPDHHGGGIRDHDQHDRLCRFRPGPGSAACSPAARRPGRDR